MSRMLKAKGAIIKDKGVMADLSRKIELFINELDDDQAVELNKLAKSREVDVLIFPAGELENIEGLISELRNSQVYSSEEEFESEDIVESENEELDELDL